MSNTAKMVKITQRQQPQHGPSPCLLPQYAQDAAADLDLELQRPKNLHLIFALRFFLPFLSQNCQF